TGLHHALTENDPAVDMRVGPLESNAKLEYSRNWTISSISMGSNGIPHFVFAMNMSLKGKAFEDALLEGTALGLVASGYAGPAFKAAFDDAVTADRAMGANVPDQFIHRRNFADQLGALLSKLLAQPTSP
ncbi:MAG: hypothetical protein ACYDA1_07575, partial [Vulcanimicrobiaceae bacterium]